LIKDSKLLEKNLY